MLAAAVEGKHRLIEPLVAAGADVNFTRFGFKSDHVELQSTPLMVAAGHGHKVCVEILIGCGADVNRTGSNGSTALMNTVDVFQNDIDCARLLIKSGASVNAADMKGETALMKAVTKGYMSVIKLFLESGADVNVANQNGSTALMMASSLKDGMDIVKVLVESGANANQTDINGKSLLMAASLKYNLSIVNTLINFGADVNGAEKLGFTPLLWVASKGHMFCIEEFAECLLGDVFPYSVGNHQDRAAFQFTNMFKLCEKIQKDRASLQRCLRLLIASGADVNYRARLSGWTALMVAALNGDINILKLLLKSGADVNSVSRRNGWSALVSAVVGSHSECVQLLIQSGADVKVHVIITGPPSWEKNVLDFALDIGNIKTIKMLLLGGVHTGGIRPSCRPLYKIKKILEVAGVLPLEGVDKDFSLIAQCREAIRKHLLHVHPPVNIYFKIGRLGMPSILERYLLYNVTLY